MIVKVETKQATAELGPNWDGLILVELVSKVNICMYNGSRLRFFLVSRINFKVLMRSGGWVEEWMDGLDSYNALRGPTDQLKLS